jgi:hypothetical protein
MDQQAVFSQICKTCIETSLLNINYNTKCLKKSVFEIFDVPCTIASSKTVSSKLVMLAGNYVANSCVAKLTLPCKLDILYI